MVRVHLTQPLYLLQAYENIMFKTGKLYADHTAFITGDHEEKKNHSQVVVDCYGRPHSHVSKTFQVK